VWCISCDSRANQRQPPRRAPRLQALAQFADYCKANVEEIHGRMDQVEGRPQ